MNEKHPSFDWSLTSWEGSRREQLRRWSQLSMDEIFAAQEEMAARRRDRRRRPRHRRRHRLVRARFGADEQSARTSRAVLAAARPSHHHRLGLDQNPDGARRDGEGCQHRSGRR